MISKHLKFAGLSHPVLIVFRKTQRTPTVKASPSPEIDYLVKKVKTEPTDSSSFISSTFKNKGKKITATAIDISSDEEEVATPTPKARAKTTLANRNTVTVASTPSKVKPCVVVYFFSFLSHLYFSLVLFHHRSHASDEDRDELVEDDETNELDGSLGDRPSPPSLGYEILIPLHLNYYYRLLHLRESLVIVPAKEDMRAEYCPSVLLVDGCPMELGPGVFDLFDEIINRSLHHMS